MFVLENGVVKKKRTTLVLVGRLMNEWNRIKKLTYGILMLNNNVDKIALKGKYKSWITSQLTILLMRTRKTPLRTRKNPMRTRKTPLKTRQTPLSKKKLPWPRSVMNIGKGMYTFNITEIKKRTSKWIIKINKKHTWDKFVKNVCLEQRELFFSDEETT